MLYVFYEYFIQMCGYDMNRKNTEFICFQDVLEPPVIALTDKEFELRVAGKSSKELWLVDYYTPWCPPCMQMMNEWRRFAKV